jgi:hypothetical protein
MLISGGMRVVECLGDLALVDEIDVVIASDNRVYRY